MTSEKGEKPVTMPRSSSPSTLQPSSSTIKNEANNTHVLMRFEGWLAKESIPRVAWKHVQACEGGMAMLELAGSGKVAKLASA